MRDSDPGRSGAVSPCSSAASTCRASWGLSDDDLPDFLQELHPVRRELARIAGDQGLASLALRFVASLPGVLGVLTGLETLAQLEENLSWMGQGELGRETMEQIDRAIPDLPRRLLDMRQWPNA